MNEQNRARGEVWSRRAARIAVVICVISLLLTVGLVVAYQRRADQRARQARDNARDKAQQIAEDVASHLDRIRPAVEKLADELTSGQLAGDDLKQRLQAAYHVHHDRWRLLEVGVAYLPEHNPVSPGQPLAPHFGLKGGGDERAFDLVDSYDYLTHDWFRDTVETGARWIEPYFGEATGRWTAGYAVPFYQAPGSSVVAGVVRMNFDLDKIRTLVREVGGKFLDEELVMTAGYMFLVSKQGKIITHPIRRYQGQDVSELGRTDGKLRVIAERLQGTAGAVGHSIVDPITAESYWVFLDDVASVDWDAAVVISKRQTLDRASTVRIAQRLSTATLVVFLCGVAFLLLRAYRGTTVRLWCFSIVSTALLLTGTIATWMFSVTGASHRSHAEVQVMDEATGEATVARHFALCKLDGDQINRIPTGVFVQSLTFTSANNVQLTGYVWQKKIAHREDGQGQDIYGFVLPESEAINLQPAYEDDDVIGWYFETTLRQQFDYSRYPFDREDVWIRFWPASMNSNVVLVPDFAGYRERKIRGIPGVEEDLVLEGWVIKDSYFSFRRNRYNVDFGRLQFRTDRRLELYFSVGLVREFVSPFVSDMIPVSVIAFLAFAVLMSATRHEESIDLYGFSTASVLGYCAALFFVLIVAHVHLRTTLASQGIIYMEYFYFVMYLVILAVSTDALLFASPRHYPLIHYKDNIIIKQLYWPLVTGAMFVITLIVFR